MKKHMKKIIAIATTLIMAMSMMLLAGCGGEEADNSGDKPEVRVLAAASLTDSLDESIAEDEKDADCTITPS